MTKIFLSYSRKDKTTMQKVKQALLDAELEVWTDEGIRAGTKSWKKAIEDAIETSQGMVALFSPDAKESEWVQAELDYAKVCDVPVFPLFVRGTIKKAIPFGYSASQWIDIREDLDGGIFQLLDEFAKRKWVKKPKKAEEPDGAEKKPKPEPEIPTPKPNPLENFFQQVPAWAWGGLGVIVALILAVAFWPDGGDENAFATQTAAALTAVAGGPTNTDTAVVASPSNTKMPATSTATEGVTPTKTRTPTITQIPTITPTPDRPPGDTIRNSKDGAIMVYVPAGESAMGSGVTTDESPIHIVYLDSFWLYRTEVTNEQYARCVRAGDCERPSNARFYNSSEYADHPVVYVNWQDAVNYCTWAGGRLPTEAEWEKAAGGTDGRGFSWGDDEPNCNLANYSGCASEAMPVDSHPQGESPYGAWDLMGNVWEWVADWYADDYYQISPKENPHGPEQGVFRVQRGGGYDSSVVWVASRNFRHPDITADNTGFRCVVEP